MPTALAVQAKTAQRLAVREIMNPERTVLEQLDRTQLWSIVKNLITTEQEWVIFVERYCSISLSDASWRGTHRFSQLYAVAAQGLMPVRQ